MRIKGILTGILIGMTLALGGCSFLEPGQEADDTSAQAQINGIITATTGIYDSEDTALVVRKDTDNATIQLENLSTGKLYTLTYDGATQLLDKHEQALSMAQIPQGSIVTVRFYKPKKALAYLKLSEESITYESLQNYTLDTAAGTITIGDVAYSLSNHVIVFSDGEQIELMDVNAVDVLDVWGWHNQIYGISVARGHGYLRLQNDSYFIGGWIEVGQSLIQKITEDMLLVVPEGTATVQVSHNGSSATQQIDFVRNQEMAWDLGDVEITEVQKGRIIFTLTPADATVTIDGKKADTASPVELEYGVHQMTVTAEGYDTVAQYIKVAQASANISVELEASEEKAEEVETAKQETAKQEIASQEIASQETSQSAQEEQFSQASSDTTEQSSQAQTTTTADTSYKVHIDSPEGVEVYLDGNYIGIAPVDFDKTAGNYVISLRKTGYQTRSYTLQIDSEDKDVTYSFSELSRLES